ncbi:MAG: 2Fe-2S iron-sulfur cluster-binding protein [Candidatus Rokuibacteriota bacterium]
MRILVSARNQAHSFDCRPGEKILYAGLRHGIALPYECGSGTCGTCKAKLVDGDIENEWPEAPGHAFLKPDAGEFLMCQCVARSDCALEISNVVASMPPSACVPVAVGGVVRRCAPLTHDVTAMDVGLDAAVGFEAGQFMMMRVAAIEGWRAYSMVNFERRATRLRFIVKKKPGGRVSEWLFDANAEGARVDLFGPLGVATFQPDVARNLLLIAGGSGISGMMSILTRACKDRHFERYEGRLYFGVRTARDVFYLDELAELKAQFPTALSMTIALSDEDVPAPLRGEHPAFGFDRGLVHAVAGQQMKGRFQNVRAYAAGPPPMVDATLRMLLLEGKLTADNIRYDKFS